MAWLTPTEPRPPDDAQDRKLGRLQTGIIHGVSRIGLVSVTALLWLPVAAVASPSDRVVQCPQFIVGQANSTAYPHHQLPARGTARNTSCATLRRIARRLHDGTYRIPSGSSAIAPKWGKTFHLRDHGRRWSCQLQNRGASGPTYAVRCRSGSSRLDWNTA